jgi:membrane-associated phospholipid phosphatase
MKNVKPLIVVIAFCLAASPSLCIAQESSSDLDAQLTPHHENFAASVLRDQASLWSSPARMERDDLKWLIPLGAGATALLVTDRATGEEMREADGIRPLSRLVSKLGSGVPMVGAAGAFNAAGKLSGNSRAAQTGVMSLEAVLQTQLVVGGIKLIANRERPNKLMGDGRFFGGGQSFPSGHAATTFAFATVLANQYEHKPWVVVGAYGLATAVSLSRVGGLNHFPSDVLIGGSIGYLIGKFVLHKHK